MVKTKFIKKIFCTLFLISSAYLSKAQYSQVITYEIKKHFGDENILKNAGNIAATFRFDSVGCNWNMLNENDYMRFKILHFYIINHRKEGEYWKRMYQKEKTVLFADFEQYMKGKLDEKQYRISADFENTAYTFNMCFYDVSKDVQHEEYEATCRFIDNKTGNVLIEYYIKMKTKQAVSTMAILAIGMSNYFRKNV